MAVNRSPAAREMARQILAGAIDGAETPDAIAEGMQRVLARVTANLCHGVGEDGCQALVTRALALTEGEYPVLADLFRRGYAGPGPVEAKAAVTREGVAPVTTALEVLLAVLIDILGGLVGADMVRNLLDPEDPPPSARRTRQAR